MAWLSQQLQRGRCAGCRRPQAGGGSNGTGGLGSQSKRWGTLMSGQSRLAGWDFGNLRSFDSAQGARVFREFSPCPGCWGHKSRIEVLEFPLGLAVPADDNCPCSLSTYCGQNTPAQWVLLPLRDEQTGARKSLMQSGSRPEFALESPERLLQTQMPEAHPASGFCFSRSGRGLRNLQFTSSGFG